MKMTQGTATVSGIVGVLEAQRLAERRPLEQVKEEVEHFFPPGICLKLTRMQAGEELTQHAHKYDHCSVMTYGMVMVSTDGGTMWETYSDKAHLVLKAGVPHIVRAILDSGWYCIHATEETDAEKVDRVLVLGAPRVEA